MDERLDVQIRLGAQRSLWGRVPPSLLAVSVDIDEQKVYFRCIFDGEPTEYDWKLMSVAATEIIADFPAPYTIKEEYPTVKAPNKMSHLKYLIYLRHERQD